MYPVTYILKCSLNQLTRVGLVWGLLFSTASQPAPSSTPSLPTASASPIQRSASWWAAAQANLDQADYQIPWQDHPIVIDPTVTGLSPGANWTAESNQSNSLYGNSVNTAGDVNGDGYADVIVGAYAFDNGQTDEGRVFVYHGSASGLSPTPNWAAEGDQANANFGKSASTAGDVNGDGYADVIIGAHLYDNGQTDEGRVVVYLGSASGLSLTPDWIAESDQASANFGEAVSTAGDVNGDGYADVIVGARLYDNGQTDEGRVFVYYGSASGLSPIANWTAESDVASATFGNAVRTAGDVNGDGYADIIIGHDAYDNGQTDEGRVVVYHGSAVGLSASPNWMVEGNQISANLGNTVSTAGDVNGDGYADVIVGARFYDNGQADEGRAYVYYGSATGLNTSANWTVESDQISANFGQSVSTAGDVNGDGYADVIVSAYAYDDGQTDEGRAFVYQGSATGLSTYANWSAESDQVSALFGRSVSVAGDVNGDGYSDIIVGAHLYDNDQADEGRAYVYHGAAVSLSPSGPNWYSPQSYDSFGYSVSTAGDVNGDGFADVIVGAPLHDNGEVNEGQAYVYYGSNTGLSSNPSWSAESDQASANFGWSVSAAGDVNGDGYADVIVGAPLYDNDQTDEGRAYVYYGSSTGLSSIPNWIAEGGQDGAQFGAAVGAAGDVNGDGYADVIVGAPTHDNGQVDEGRAFIYLGGSDGLQADPIWTGEGGQDNGKFGYSVGAAGDVNGDGYSDIIVGAPYYDNGQTDEGRAFVYAGFVSGVSAGSSWITESNQISATFGYAVGTAGDVNGDGYADVIVGAPLYDNGQLNEGRTFVYQGSALGLSPDVAWAAESNLDFANYGASARTAGDINGDGYADVIVGAYTCYLATYSEGCAFAYHGSASGLNPNYSWMDRSYFNQAFFGRSVSTAGDVNGDSYADVIVGAPGGIYPGWLYSYFGNTNVGLSLQPGQRRPDNSAPIAPLGHSDSPDSFRLALLGRTPFGRGRVKLEWEVKPLGVIFDGTDTQSSAVWLDTGTTGAAFNELVSGLSAGTAYHWRVRLHYHPTDTPYQSHGRWLTMPWNGWNETDLRTLDTAIAGLTAQNDGPTPLGNTTTFSAAIADGTHVAYTWDFGDNEAGMGAGVTHTYASVGVYTATITATNNASLVTATTTVVVDEAIAGLMILTDSPTPFGNLTTLTATLTTGSNVTYTWDLGDQTLGAGPVVTHTYPEIMLYTATVTAANSVSTLTATIPITITDAYIAGLAAHNDSPTALGLSTTFTASVVTGTHVTYLWDLGDGTTDEGPVVAHAYPDIGLYTATLTATNSMNTVTTTTPVTIIDMAITGLAVHNDGPTLFGHLTTFTATLATGTHVTYLWDFGDGSALTPTFSSDSGLGLVIPDNGCVGGNYLEHSLFVPTWGLIFDIDVTLSDLRHTWDNDLRLYLRGPDGTQVALSTNNGGNGDDYYQTIFDDEASLPITTGVPPFTGRFRPEEPLAALDGKTTWGEWTLRICDAGPTAVGTLNEWGLTIASVVTNTTGVISHTYASPGVYTATVTAINSVSQASHTMSIAVVLQRLYLPLIMRLRP